MTTLNLNSTASDLDAQIENTKAERASLQVDVDAMDGHGWIADVDRMAKPYGRIGQAEIDAVLAGAPLPNVEVDRAAKQRRLLVLHGTIRQLCERRARMRTGELQTRADASVGRLRDLVDTAFKTSGSKWRPIADAVNDVLDDLQDIRQQHRSLRNDDVQDVPGLTGLSTPLESAGSHILQAAAHLTEATAAYEQAGK